MTDKEIKDLVKNFSELDKAWEKIQSEKSESLRETEEAMYRYRMLREREMLKESLPEPEFTKAKRAEQTSEVSSEISELEKAAIEYFKEALNTGNDSKLEWFKAGANWQKQQMMKEAVETEVFTSFGGNIVVNADGFSKGDKVKMIIIKES